MIVDSLKYSLTEELRIENNAISVHIFLALFSSRLALLSILLASCHFIQHSPLILNSPHSSVKFSSERNSFVLHCFLFAARYSHVSVNLRY